MSFVQYVTAAAALGALAYLVKTLSYEVTYPAHMVDFATQPIQRNLLVPQEQDWRYKYVRNEDKGDVSDNLTEALDQVIEERNDYRWEAAYEDEPHYVSDYHEANPITYDV